MYNYFKGVSKNRCRHVIQRLKEAEIFYICHYVIKQSEKPCDNPFISVKSPKLSYLNVSKVGREKDRPKLMVFAIISKKSIIPFVGFANQ